MPLNRKDLDEAQERAAARAWGRGIGIDVPDRGRMPTGLVDNYRWYQQMLARQERRGAA